MDRSDNTSQLRSTPAVTTEAERAWFYADVNAEIGPLTTQQLKQKIAATPSFKQMFVWCEGMAEWKKAGELPELFQGSTSTTSPSDRLKDTGRAKGSSVSLVKILTVALFAILLSSVIFLLTLSDPSTNDLDRDISSIKAEIASAKDESEKYSGGLLKGLIETRGEMLRLTEAMLNAKRKSIIRRINLQFQIEGRNTSSSAASELAKIENDMTEARSRVAAAEARAGQYTGGMVQALALVTVETERLAVAQLQVAYYNAKYGLSAPKLKALESGEVPGTSTPGTVVKDRDAL